MKVAAAAEAVDREEAAVVHKNQFRLVFILFDRINKSMLN